MKRSIALAIALTGLALQGAVFAQGTPITLHELPVGTDRPPGGFTSTAQQLAWLRANPNNPANFVSCMMSREELSPNGPWFRTVTGPDGRQYNVYVMDQQTHIDLRTQLHIPRPGGVRGGSNVLEINMRGTNTPLTNAQARARLQSLACAQGLPRSGTTLPPGFVPSENQPYYNPSPWRPFQNNWNAGNAANGLMNLPQAGQLMMIGYPAAADGLLQAADGNPMGIPEAAGGTFVAVVGTSGGLFIVGEVTGIAALGTGGTAVAVALWPATACAATAAGGLYVGNQISQIELPLGDGATTTVSDCLATGMAATWDTVAVIWRWEFDYSLTNACADQGIRRPPRRYCNPGNVRSFVDPPYAGGAAMAPTTPTIVPPTAGCSIAANARSGEWLATVLLIGAIVLLLARRRRV